MEQFLLDMPNIQGEILWVDFNDGTAKQMEIIFMARLKTHFIS